MRAGLIACPSLGFARKAAGPHPGPLPRGEGVYAGFSHTFLNTRADQPINHHSPRRNAGVFVSGDRMNREGAKSAEEGKGGEVSADYTDCADNKRCLASKLFLDRSPSNRSVWG